MRPILKYFIICTGIAVMVVAVFLSFWHLGGGTARGFAAHPARVIVAAATLAMMIAKAIFMPRLSKATCKGEQHDKRQDAMVLCVALLALAEVILSPMTDAAGFLPLPGGDALRYAGAAFYVAGGLLMIWAPAYLGSQYSIHVTVQRDHRLVTTGPYSVMRHPRYTGCILWGLGIPLAFASGPAMPVAAIYVWLFFWRIRVEERLLDEHFGEEWRVYAGRTKRLLPFIY